MLSCRCLVECWSWRVCETTHCVAPTATDLLTSGGGPGRHQPPLPLPLPSCYRQGDRPPTSTCKLAHSGAPFDFTTSQAGQSRVFMKRQELPSALAAFLFPPPGSRSSRRQSPKEHPEASMPCACTFSTGDCVLSTYVRPRARNPVRRWLQTELGGSSSRRTPPPLNENARCQVAPQRMPL